MDHGNQAHPRLQSSRQLQFKRGARIIRVIGVVAVLGTNKTADNVMPPERTIRRMCESPDLGTCCRDLPSGAMGAFSKSVGIIWQLDTKIT